jgi:hypothetical protein
MKAEKKIRKDLTEEGSGESRGDFSRAEFIFGTRGRYKSRKER